MMELLVGLLLVTVFLAFAALMFLERISALLALPLMALAFLLVALAADVATGDVRLAEWRALRRAQAGLLHEKATLFSAIAAQLSTAAASEADASPATLADLLPAARGAAAAFAARADAEIAQWPRFFVAHGHPGQIAGFRGRLAAIALEPELAALQAQASAANGDAADRDRLRTGLTRVTRLAARTLARHPEPPPASWRASVAATATYVAGHLIMVLRAGALYLHAAIIATIFGGMFAVYVRNLRVAERMVYWTAEFAGDRPRVIALAIFLVTAGIFTSVGGLGTVIMLGTIILPILRSVGLSPIVASGLFLIAIAMGGTLQPVSRRLWMDFYGIAAGDLDAILWTLVALYALVGVGWIAWGARRRQLSSFSASDEPIGPPSEVTTVPARLMIAPLIPVALVYFLGVEEITAFTASIAYMFLCVCRRSGAPRVLARSLIEGAQLVMPPVLLMFGIGILVVALGSEPVQASLRPLLERVVPQSRWQYIALFGLAAPLALYRGPLNVWGMGLAVSATLLAAGTLPPAAVLCAILAAGMLQGVCDPTNTANVWIAGFQGVTVNQILRWTLLPVWSAAIAAVVIFGYWFLP